MKTSIATVSISGELSDKLQAIAAAGFDGVEIFENDLLTFGGSPAEAGQLARDLGLAITLFQPFRDFEGLPQPPRIRPNVRDPAAHLQVDRRAANGRRGHDAAHELDRIDDLQPDRRDGGIGDDPLDPATCNGRELDERAPALGVEAPFRERPS